MASSDAPTILPTVLSGWTSRRNGPFRGHRVSIEEKLQDLEDELANGPTLAPLDYELPGSKLRYRDYLELQIRGLKHLIETLAEDIRQVKRLAKSTGAVRPPAAATLQGIELVRDGMSPREASAVAGVKLHTLLAALQRLNLHYERRRPGRERSFEVMVAVDLVREGKTVAEASKLSGANASSIRGALKDFGVSPPAKPARPEVAKAIALVERGMKVLDACAKTGASKWVVWAHFRKKKG